MDIGHQKQGVYTNIITCDTEHVEPQIYVGRAVGPYGRRSLGVRDRIRTHLNDAKRSKRPSSLHHKKLQMQEWHAHWALLVSFPSAVESETVVFAHAVMVILFGSYTDLHYSSCRPKGMAPTPQWGLNEIGPLGRNGLSFYNKVEGVSDPEVIDRTR